MQECILLVITDGKRQANALKTFQDAGHQVIITASDLPTASLLLDDPGLSLGCVVCDDMISIGSETIGDGITFDLVEIAGSITLSRVALSKGIKVIIALSKIRDERKELACYPSSVVFIDTQPSISGPWSHVVHALFPGA